MKITPSLILIAGLITCVNAWAIDTYDSTTNQLTIPTVQVGSTTYTNVVISVGNVLSIGSSPANGYADIYNSTNGQLMIPSVLVGATTYNNVIITVGSVLSVGGILSKPSIFSENTNVVTTNIQDYPQDGYGYDTTALAFGKFGSKSANCFVTQSITRKGSVSSSTLPDAPLYVICQQPNGDFKEVSQQLFGKQLYINGEYPLVADFNGDGVDDIFVIRAWDGDFVSTDAYALISNSSGGYHINDMPITTSSNLAQQSAAMDLNHDGCLDVLFASDYYFIGDCTGKFTAGATIPNGAGYLANQTTNTNQWGTGICAGDFIGSGGNQFVITDGRGMPTWTNQPNAIFELNNNLVLTSAHSLPVPYWNVFYNSAGATHNFSCRVADINNDGKQDVLIFTRPWAEFTSNIWTDQSYIQVYLNLGNWNFLDISATAFPNYNTNTTGSYSSRIIDFNNDGYLDVALEGPTSHGIASSGNQIWINNKNNTFSPVFTNELTSLYSNYQQQFGAGGNTNYATNTMSILPIQVNGKWNYIMQMADLNGNYHIGVANTQYTFK